MDVLANVLSINGPFVAKDVEAIFTKYGSTFQVFGASTYFVSSQESSKVNTTKTIVADLKLLPIVFAFTHIGVKTGCRVDSSTAVPNITKIKAIVTG